MLYLRHGERFRDHWWGFIFQKRALLELRGTPFFPGTRGVPQVHLMMPQFLRSSFGVQLVAEIFMGFLFTFGTMATTGIVRGSGAFFSRVAGLKL